MGLDTDHSVIQRCQTGCTSTKLAALGKNQLPHASPQKALSVTPVPVLMKRSWNFKDQKRELSEHH